MTEQEIEKKLKRLNLGVIFSGITLIVAIINTFMRLKYPTFIVANPPTSNNPYWSVGPQNMLTVASVAKKELKSSDEIIKLIKDGKITPIPVIINEHNVTWAVDPSYKISE